MESNAELIFEMVDRHTLAFENMVLARFLLDAQAAKVMSGILFKTHDGLDARSFGTPENTGLGVAIDTYHHANSHRAEQSAAVLQFGLSKTMQEGKLAGDVQVLWGRLMQLSAEGVQNWSSVMHCTKAGMLYWLNKGRMSFAVELARAKNWGADKLMNWLRAEKLHISSLSEQKKVDHGLWSSLNTQIADVIRFPCSIPRLNFVLGGGFGRGEATLAICPTGAGKTALSTQLTGEWCMQGLKGIYVTTERTQPAHKLALRMISQQCGIPFKQIKDGIKATTLQDVQQVAVGKMQQAIGDHNLRFVHWFELTNPNDVEQLPGLIDQYAQMLGGLDFFILDWLGGALEVSTDKDKKRLIYQRGADIVAEVAANYDVSGLVLAQAHENARNKPRVTAADAQENKSMGNNMTNIMGVSAMMDKSVSGEGEGANYMREQYLNLPKTRGGEGGLVPVDRKFEYQKFTPRAGITH